MCSIVKAAVPVVSNAVVDGASLILLLQSAVPGQPWVAGHVVIIDTAEGDRASNVWNMVKTGWSSVHVLVLAISEWGTDVLLYSIETNWDVRLG